MASLSRDQDAIQTWVYAHDADITFGEVHQSKVPKIALICTIAGIVVVGGLSFAFRDYISDYINNPQVVFSSEYVNEQDGKLYVDAEISNKDFFNPKKYILGYDKDTDEIKNAKYEVSIDTSQLNFDAVGSYPIIYHSHNKVISEDYEVIINVKDKTAPVITLELDEDKPYHVDLSENGSYKLTIIRNEENKKNFDPGNYIKSVTDNYTTDPDKIQVDYTKHIDFTAKSVDIIYNAYDESGNRGMTALTLIIEEDVDAIQKENEEALKKAEEERKQLEKEKEQLEKEKEELEEKKDDDNSNDNDNNNNNNSGGSGGNNVTPPPQQQQQPDPPPQQHYEPSSISARDVTLSISACGSDEYAIANACIAALTYRGSAGSAMPSGMPGFDVPLDPGTYTITWTTSDGLSCTQTLTLTE